jgi:hypothetical protein
MIESTQFSVRRGPSKSTPSTLEPAPTRRVYARPTKLDEATVRPVLTDLLTRRPELRAVAFADIVDAMVRWSA